MCQRGASHCQANCCTDFVQIGDSVLVTNNNSIYKFNHFLDVNPIALRKAKIVHDFGLSECNRVKLVKCIDFVGTILR